MTVPEIWPGQNCGEKIIIIIMNAGKNHIASPTGIANITYVCMCMYGIFILKIVFILKMVKIAH